MPCYEYSNQRSGRTLVVMRSMVARTPLARMFRAFHDWTLKLRGYQRVFSPLAGRAESSWKSSLEKQLMGDFATYERRNGSGSVEKATRMSTAKIKHGVQQYVATYSSEKRMNEEQ